MTSSEDGTLRLWDTSEVVQKTVIKPSLLRTARVTISACSYNSNGTSIAAGLVDGSIQVWDAKGVQSSTISGSPQKGSLPCLDLSLRISA